MTDTIVTLKSYSDPVEANIAKSALEEKGIPCQLADEEMVNMAWHMGNAIGGVKLLVNESDEENARAILSERKLRKRSYSHSRSFPRTTAEDEIDQPTSREETAERAFRAVVLAIFLFPVHLYVSWILWDVFQSKERLEGSYRVKAWFAAVTNIGCWALFLFVVKTMLGSWG